MNEQIREIVEQCVGDRPYNNSFDWEKFAELIVKEVFSKLEDEGFEVYEPVIEAVKKHFGVKE